MEKSQELKKVTNLELPRQMKGVMQQKPFHVLGTHELEHMSDNIGVEIETLSNDDSSSSLVFNSSRDRALAPYSLWWA